MPIVKITAAQRRQKESYFAKLGQRSRILKVSANLDYCFWVQTYINVYHYAFARRLAKAF